MAVEITQGGLQWEASIDTTRLATDVVTVQELLSSLKGGFFSPEENEKQFQEIKQKVAEFQMTTQEAVIEATERLKGVTEIITGGYSDAEAEATAKLKQFAEEREDANRKEMESLIALQQQILSEGGDPNITQTKSKPGTTEQKANPVGDIIGKDFQAIITAAENAYNGLDAETKAFIDEMVELQTQLKQVEAAQKALNKANAEGKVSAQDYSNTSSVLSAQQKQISESIDLVTQRQKDYDALNKVSVTSLNEKKAALTQLRQAYFDLTDAERKSASGQQMAQEIKDLRAEIAQLNPENVEKVKSSVKGAYAELSQLKNLIASGQLSGEDLEKATARAVELKNEISNLNQKLKLFSSNTAGIDAIADGVKGLIAGYTTLSGIMGLMNSDSTQVEETIENVTSAMAVLNGVQEIAALLSKESELNEFLRLQIQKLRITATEEQIVVTEAMAVAEVEQTVATEAATVATGGLNAVMLANPAGILLVVLTAVVAAIQLFSDNTDKATEKQNKMNDALAEANDLYASLIELYNRPYADKTKNAQDALALAQAQGKSEAEIYQLRLKATQLSKEENQLGFASLNLDGATFEQRQKSLALLQTELEVRTEEELTLLNRKKLTGELTKIEERQLEVIQSRIKVLNSIISPAQQYLDGILNAESEIDNQRAAEQKRQQDDALKSSVAYWQARIEASKKGSEEERAASLGLNKAQYNQTISNPNITSGELEKATEDKRKADYEADKKFNLARIEDSKNLVEAQLAKVKEGSLAELQYKKMLLELNSKAQILQTDEDADAILKINAETEKAIADLKTKYRLDALKVEAETEVANTNTSLSRARKGSEEELNLKKQLVDQKALLDDISAQASIKNEQLLVATLKEIYAKSAVDKRSLDNTYRSEKLKKDLDALDKSQKQYDAYYDKIINDPKSSARQIEDAEIKKQLSRISTLLGEIQRIEGEIKKGGLDAAELENKIAELRGKIAEANNVINKIGANSYIAQLRRLGDFITNLSNSFKGLSQALETTDQKAAATLDTLGSLADIAGNALSAVGKFLSGDIGGGISSTISAVSSVFSFGAKARESERQARAEIEAFNEKILEGEIDVNIQYRERQRLQAQINDLKLQGLKQEQELLDKQKQQNYDDYNRILTLLQQQQYIAGKTTEKYGGVFGIGKKTRTVDQLASLSGMTYDQIEELYMSGQLTDKAKELFETLQKLNEEGADIDQQLIDLQKQAQEIFTGTTSDSILDGIVDGFKNGLRSAADFADNFEDLMRNAVLNAIKYQVLQPGIEEFYKRFAEDSQSGGGLTENEIDSLQNFYNQVLDDAKKELDNLQQITGLNIGSSISTGSSLSKGVQNITESTAEIIAAQFGAERITQTQILSVATQTLTAINRIADNTARLESIERMMRDQQLNGIKIKP